jgi:predicted AAA+ superfamily ATPase
MESETPFFNKYWSYQLHLLWYYRYMYKRLLKPDYNEHYLLLGARGTGKTMWLKSHYRDNVVYIDLLDSDTYNTLLATPNRLEEFIPQNFNGRVIIDEIQKIPALLDEIHKHIEDQCEYRFALSGSSARKLKRAGANLLAGRAINYHMYPMTITELGEDFSLEKSLTYGNLPRVYNLKSPQKYIQAYITNYLTEEIQQEALTRNLPAFRRFLEAASFSQAQPINFSKIASDCHVHRKVVTSYFSILNETLISHELPIFHHKAKRELITKNKFYFFDVGIFMGLRPKGPLDSLEEFQGAAIETLLLQELMALNEYYDWGFKLYYWHTRDHREVDFILYGPKGLFAIEVKRSRKFQSDELDSLKLFLDDYPMAQAYFLYGGNKSFDSKGVKIRPYLDFIKKLPKLIN